MVNEPFTRLGRSRGGRRRWHACARPRFTKIAPNIVLKIPMSEPQGGMMVVRQLAEIFAIHDIRAEVLAASIRHPLHST
jgi:hypothetical protein